MRMVFLVAALVLVLTESAFADERGAVTGATGAATGSILGAPTGAVGGGVVGAGSGAAHSGVTIGPDRTVRETKCVRDAIGNEACTRLVR